MFHLEPSITKTNKSYSYTQVKKMQIKECDKKVAELRKKLGFTALMLLIFRLGGIVLLPGLELKDPLSYDLLKAV